MKYEQGKRVLIKRSIVGNGEGQVDSTFPQYGVMYAAGISSHTVTLSLEQPYHGLCFVPVAFSHLAEAPINYHSLPCGVVARVAGSETSRNQVGRLCVKAPNGDVVLISQGVTDVGDYWHARDAKDLIFEVVPTEKVEALVK